MIDGTIHGVDVILAIRELHKHNSPILVQSILRHIGAETTKAHEKTIRNWLRRRGFKLGPDGYVPPGSFWDIRR